jgi:hypothetical protein
VITNDVSDYINLLVRTNHTICNHTLFGPKREELAGGWRRLRNEELHNLYSS